MGADLTPEERQKIYLEEKVRAEARDKLAADHKQAATKKNEKEAKQGVVVLLGLVILVFVGVKFCPNEPGVKLTPERDVAKQLPQDDGESPLSRAASAGSAEAVKVLLKAGADPNARVSGGWSPLHRAASSGSGETVKVLLESGADPNTRDKLGDSPLHSAAYTHRGAVVRVLLEAGADPNARNKAGWSPLHRAASTDKAFAGKGEVVRVLLEAGADPNAGNKAGWSPLHWAASAGSVEAVKVLLKAGADPDARDQYGVSPLNWAAYRRSGVVARMLIKAGAEVNAGRDDNTGTPLHAAVQKPKSAEAMKVLIEAGADPNGRDQFGRFPLHKAVINNNFVAVIALIDAGAEVNVRDDSGFTPLHHAASTKKKVVSVLLMAGADPYARDNEGNMAFHPSGLIQQFRERGAYRRKSQTRTRRLRPLSPSPHISPGLADQLRRQTETRRDRQRQPTPTVPRELIDATTNPWPNLPSATPNVQQRPRLVAPPSPEQDWKTHKKVKSGLKESGVTTTLPKTTDKRELSSNIIPPTVLSRIEPVYSEAARKANLEGTVELSAIIRKDGSIETVKVLRGLGLGLDESAVRALKRWRFRPGMKDGSPVDLRVNVEVTFSLRSRL